MSDFTVKLTDISVGLEALLSGFPTVNVILILLFYVITVITKLFHRGLAWFCPILCQRQLSLFPFALPHDLVFTNTFNVST